MSDSEAQSASQAFNLPRQESLGANGSPAQSDVEISDLESDLEPEQMIDKYISLQTKLYYMNPSFLVQALKGTGNRRKNRTSSSRLTSSTPTRKADRIQAQIAQLTSDILFDKEQADILWATKYVELCQETTLRRRLDLDNGPSNPSDNSPPVESRETSNTEEPDVILGSLFSALPDISTTLTDGYTMTNSFERGKTIETRSFEKWTGIGPKRVLEEACKAR